MQYNNTTMFATSTSASVQLLSAGLSAREYQKVVITPAEFSDRINTVVLFTFFAGLGIILNGLPILLTVCTNIHKNKVNVMVAGVSTSGLLGNILFVFGQTQYILYNEQLPPIGCTWLAFFFFTTVCFDFIFPPLISLNRYVSLYFGGRYDLIYTKRNIWYMFAGCWAFCTVVPLIFTLNGKAKFDHDNSHCCMVVKDSAIGWKIFYWLAIIGPLIGFSDGTMLFCNWKIYKKLSDHDTIRTLKHNVVHQNREVLYFLIADMVFPIVFHTTYHTAKFISVNRTDLLQQRLYLCLFFLNSCVRGMITLTMLRPYRRALKNLLTCKCGGAHTEIITL